MFNGDPGLFMYQQFANGLSQHITRDKPTHNNDVGNGCGVIRPHSYMFMTPPFISIAFQYVKHCFWFQVFYMVVLNILPPAPSGSGLKFLFFNLKEIIFSFQDFCIIICYMALRK